MFTANVLFLKKTKSSFHNHTFLSLITLTKVLAYLWRKKGSFSIIWLFFTWIVIISPFLLIKSLMEKQSRQCQNKGITLKVQHKLCLNFNHFHHFNYLSNFLKGWGQSVKLGPHSAIWGKLGTALQAYTLNPCTKFPPNPTSRKVNT